MQVRSKESTIKIGTQDFVFIVAVLNEQREQHLIGLSTQRFLAIAGSSANKLHINCASSTKPTKGYCPHDFTKARDQVDAVVMKESSILQGQNANLEI